MIASLLMAAGLGCAQMGQADAAGEAGARAAESRIAEVTVYQGQALVTRVVNVPEGEGTVSLLVSPLPGQVIANSVFAEGSDAARVLSTRIETRVVKRDLGAGVKAKQEQLMALKMDVERIEREVAVQEEDLRYMQKLEGFTGTQLFGLTAQGRLDSAAILTLSEFLMQKRGAKSKTETELKQQRQNKLAAVEKLGLELGELQRDTGRALQQATIVVRKTANAAGTVRLGYLVNGANWVPQYRLKGSAVAGPVKLDYLAAVVQQSGEAWSGVRMTLSNARPSQDAAPPELLPLKMDVAGAARENGPVDAEDDRSKRIIAELAKVVSMPFANETPLDDILQYLKKATTNAELPDGLQIYLDPVGLQEAETTPRSNVSIDVSQVPLRTSLRLLLNQLGLDYRVRDGLIMISSRQSFEDPSGDRSVPREGGFGAGMGGNDAMMAGTGNGSLAPGSGGMRLNATAAVDQAEELRVSDQGGSAKTGAEKDGPGVTFRVANALDVPSRNDSQLLELARVELPAEYFAKAVPVLTPRVYRLAKLTNRSEVVLLPGDATVYVDGEFVGKMRLPMVAAGEPFFAGFGVDPQVQVSRRLVSKTRAVKGGNQVFDYEFRIGLRNYRGDAVKVQLWDRLPKPQGEAIGVNVVKTSTPLSTDAAYERVSRADNLLRWDLDLPKGTIGDKTLYVNYEFQLEYARELPQPRFVSGGLREGPIGGGAMGMGGMGGGMGAGFR